MNRRQVLFGSSLGMLIGGRSKRPAVGHYRLQDDRWTSALPDAVTFEEITNPSAEELTRAAQLASVTRNTWGPDANVGGICFDPSTGGPKIVIVEDGTLRVSVHQPDDQWIDTLEVSSLPTAFLAERDHAPVTIVPESRVELTRGGAITFPYGSTCGKSGDLEDNPVVFLEVTMLPGMVSPPTNHEDLGMTGKTLDVSFGAATINEPVPPVVVAGRLRTDAGGSLALEDLGMPLALFVEGGDATLNAVYESGLTRDASLPEYEPSSPLASGEDVVLSPGQLVYIPATATGIIAASGPVSFMMVGLVLSAT